MPNGYDEESEKGPHKVIYSDERISSSMDSENSDYFKLYYTKSKDWSYEQEWRIVTQQNKKEDTKESKDANDFFIYKFKIPHTCIQEITIGINADQSLTCKILKAAKRLSFIVYKAKRSDKFFNLERDICWDPSKNPQDAQLPGSKAQRGGKGFS